VDLSYEPMMIMLKRWDIPSTPTEAVTSHSLVVTWCLGNKHD